MKKILTIDKLKRARPQAKKATRSSTVNAHSYNPETGHLTVTFRDGRQYRYEGVDKDTGEGLAKAPSAGKYLHAHVIGKFDAVKL